MFPDWLIDACGHRRCLLGGADILFADAAASPGASNVGQIDTKFGRHARGAWTYAARRYGGQVNFSRLTIRDAGSLWLFGWIFFDLRA